MRCRIVLDPDPEVRRWVLLHWLDSLGGLNWFGPGEEAQAQALLAELRGKADPGLLAQALRRSDPGDLAAFAGHPSEIVRAEVAARTPDLAALDQLSRQASPQVRRALLSNRALPRDLVWPLVQQTPDFFYHTTLFLNPQLTPEDWAALLADGGPAQRPLDKSTQHDVRQLP